MSCNTNNGTERINGDLKHDELEGFKNCTLSELLEIIIIKFLLKLYRKYVSLDVKYSSEYKRYTDVVPNLLQNGPRELQWIPAITNTRYLELSALSNFLFGPFSIYSLFPYKMSRYLELRYLE